MCTPVSSNGLNYSTYNNNNQETVSNYTKNTENITQQKNLHDYAINTKEEHKLKKIASFILNAIKYFLCVAFFPITIIVLIVIKLNSLKSNDSKSKKPTTQATLEKQAIQSRLEKRDIQEKIEELATMRKKLEEIAAMDKKLEESATIEMQKILKNTTDMQDLLKESDEQQTLKEPITQEFDYKKAEDSINKNSMEDAYNKMFDSDKFSKIKGIQNKSMTAIEKRNFLSKLFIKDIEDQLGEITEKEQQIIETMKSLPRLKLQHQSKHKLVNDNILKIYSRDRIKIADTTNQMDITLHGVHGMDNILKNTDFVYFSIDFSGSSIKNHPTIVTHGEAFHGENSYVIPENIINKNGYFTLVDQSTSEIYSRSKTSLVLYNNGMKEFTNLFYKVSNRIKSSKYNLTPMFSLEDIRLAMALHIIMGIRQVDKAIATEEYEKEREILLNQRTKFMIYLLKRDENQNQLLNTILHLEYHAPVVVEAKPGEYAEHKVSRTLALPKSSL